MKIIFSCDWEFFSTNWEKILLNLIGNGALFWPLRHPKKIPGCPATALISVVATFNFDQIFKKKKKKKKRTLCPVTVLVDSQVSDRYPWATCFLKGQSKMHCSKCCFLLMMAMVELILKKKCKFLAKFKINKNIYLDFDMTFLVLNLIQ